MYGMLAWPLQRPGWLKADGEVIVDGSVRLTRSGPGKILKRELREPHWTGDPRQVHRMGRASAPRAQPLEGSDAALPATISAADRGRQPPRRIHV